MGIDASWRRITSAQLETLPEAPGVFELASLVRNVLMIGADRGGGLRSTVQTTLDDPRLRTVARYLRFELSSDPVAKAGQMLSDYRTAHRGELPSAQPPSAVPLTAIPQPGEARLRSVRREEHAKPAPAGLEPTFLRRRLA